MYFNQSQGFLGIRRGLAAAGVLLLAATTACSSDGDELKQDVIEAMDNQNRLSTYAYKGSLMLDQHQTWGESDSQPLTTALLRTLKQGTLSWEGQVDEQAGRTEADLAFSPVNGPVLQVPVIVDGTTAYVQTTAMNDSVRSYKLQLPQQATSIGQSAEWIHAFAESAVRSIRSRDFDKKGGEADGDSRFIRVKLDRKALLMAAQAFGKKELGELLETLSASGTITAEQAKRIEDYLKGDEFASGLKDIRIEEPGLLEFEIDEGGLLRATRLVLAYEWPGEEPESIAFDYKVTPLEGPPEFLKPIPEQAVELKETIQTE